MQAEDLRGFAERLADFKVPSEFHFVEDIRRTGSGQVMRHRLADLLD